MELNLTSKQKTVLWFVGSWFVLMIIGAFARADESWGHTMLYLSGSCLTVAVMKGTKPIGFVAQSLLGIFVLIAALAITILTSVMVQNAIVHIDPLEVWATCLYHTEVLVKIPWEIWLGLSEWWRTGSSDAFRSAGCHGHHLFLVLFFTILLGVTFLKGLSRWNGAPA